MPLKRQIELTALLTLALLAPATAAAQPPPSPYVPTTRAAIEKAVSPATPIDECQVIARVNGEVILACEMLWRVNLRMEEIGARIPPGKVAEVRNQLLQELLMQAMDMQILYADFRRNMPGADLKAIHDSLRTQFDEEEAPRLMKEVGVEDPRKLQARLVELGTSLGERREGYYKSMIARGWISETLKYNKEVTHQAMLDYYRDNAKDYDYPTQARWEELMVRYDRFSSDREAYVAMCAMGTEAINQLRASGAADEPVFGEIAKRSSHGITAHEGGLHDWTTKGALAAEQVDEALFTLPVGQMSPIIRGPQGFHIVHVLERKQAGRTPFTDVQPEIRQAILDSRFKAAITKKVTSLKREARVWTVFTGDLERQVR